MNYKYKIDKDKAMQKHSIQESFFDIDDLNILRELRKR